MLSECFGFSLGYVKNQGQFVRLLRQHKESDGTSSDVHLAVKKANNEVAIHKQLGSRRRGA